MTYSKIFIKVRRDINMQRRILSEFLQLPEKCTYCEKSCEDTTTTGLCCYCKFGPERLCKACMARAPARDYREELLQYIRKTGIINAQRLAEDLKMNVVMIGISIVSLMNRSLSSIQVI